jgi:surface protein
MSFRTIQSSAMGPRHSAIAGKPGFNQYASPAPIVPWVRNPSWAALPSVGNTEEKFVGIHAVYPDSNFLALSATGDYTVDWGDGTVENFSSGVQANHQYSYAAAGLTDSAVTFQDAGDTVTKTAHGYTDGMTISFSSVTTTTGIAVGQVYYVVNAATDTFQVSATSGGSALALTNDGTGVILPYKTAVVVVTPQAGQTFTNLNLNLKHTQAGLQTYTSGWLDILISGPNLTSLQIAGNTSTINVRHRYLEQAQLISANSIASMAYLFSGCGELVSLPVWTTSAAALTNTSFMFQSCSSLQTVPLFNTAAVTNMSSMFSFCSSLQTVPLFNTAAVTTMQSMFQSCSSLQTVPLFNTAAVTNMSGMFNNCFSLQTVPAFNCNGVTSSTNFNTMFATCSSLITMKATDIKYTFSVANCKLSATALNEIYTNLPTVTGQTITVTGNWGTAADDPTIATAKGWTVTG